MEIYASGDTIELVGKPFRIVLTVMHLNHIPEDIRDENLKAACQRCHLRYDAERHKKTRSRNFELRFQE